MQISWSYLSRKFPPQVRAEIFKKLDDVVARGDFTLGREVKEFEDAFAAKIGVKHAIGVGNGTDALRLSLIACGIEPGDEVITTPFSFFATAEVISLLGAKPIYADIDPKTYLLNPALLEAAITEKKAIVPVSL